MLSRGDDFPAMITACAMFPRRPKVSKERIEMTVNEEVYLMSRYLQQANVPAFLGFPRVASLSEFTGDFECLWFAPTSQEDCYTHHGIMPRDAMEENPTLFGPFENEGSIHEYLAANATRRPWCELLDVLFEIHSKIGREGLIAQRFRFGPPYKPVYFLMW
jgi:hypothetical protein